MQRPTAGPSDLADDVLCLWSAEMAAGERLVPDGCIDLVWIPEQGRLWVCGPERTAWISPTPEGTTAVGVRLRPGSAPRLLRTDASDLADRRVELPAVVPGRHARLALDRLADSADPSAVLVDEVRRLRDRADPPSASDEHIVRMATRHRSGRVRDAADDAGLTPSELLADGQPTFPTTMSDPYKTSGSTSGSLGP